jgi:hypothetical protein
MGNSYSLSTPYAGSAGIDVPELSDLAHERSIGNARFMKSIRARHRDGVALAKVTVKPYSDCSLKEYGDKILGERVPTTSYPMSHPMLIILLTARDRGTRKATGRPKRPGLRARLRNPDSCLSGSTIHLQLPIRPHIHKAVP